MLVPVMSFARQQLSRIEIDGGVWRAGSILVTDFSTLDVFSLRSSSALPLWHRMMEFPMFLLVFLWPRGRPSSPLPAR
jgi:hypothetical protein